MRSRLIQLLSIVISLAVYAEWLNWKASVLLVITIAFHEQCHLWAAQRLGLKTNMFFLIPFVGGISLITQRYKRYTQQAIVAIAGPAGGGLLAILTAIVFFATGGHIMWLASSAIFMCMINSLNLMPLSFMDGGQLMGVINYSVSRTLGVVCMCISTIVAIVLLSYLNIILGIVIGLFGSIQVFSEVKNLINWRKGVDWLLPDEWLYPPKSLTKGQIALTGLCWFGVLVALIATTVLLFAALPHA